MAKPRPPLKKHEAEILAILSESAGSMMLPEIRERGRGRLSLWQSIGLYRLLFFMGDDRLVGSGRVSAGNAFIVRRAYWPTPLGLRLLKQYRKNDRSENR